MVLVVADTRKLGIAEMFLREWRFQRIGCWYLLSSMADIGLIYMLETICAKMNVLVTSPCRTPSFPVEASLVGLQKRYRLESFNKTLCDFSVYVESVSALRQHTGNPKPSERPCAPHSECANSSSHTMLLCHER